MWKDALGWIGQVLEIGYQERVNHGTTCPLFEAEQSRPSPLSCLPIIILFLSPPTPMLCAGYRSCLVYIFKEQKVGKVHWNLASNNWACIGKLISMHLSYTSLMTSFKFINEWHIITPPHHRQASPRALLKLMYEETSTPNLTENEQLGPKFRESTSRFSDDKRSKSKWRKCPWRTYW